MRSKYHILIILFAIALIGCGDSQLGGILGDESAKAGLAFVAKLGPTSATLSWKCSLESKGTAYSNKGATPSVSRAKNHFVVLENLQPNTDYTTILTCGSQKIEEGTILHFAHGSRMILLKREGSGLWVVSARMLFRFPKSIYSIR